MRFRNMACERPPRLRRQGGLRRLFVDAAATPPHEEGNISLIPNQFRIIHTVTDRLCRSAGFKIQLIPLMATGLIIFLVFTGAFAAAAEYAWWGPQRRMRMEVEQRLRGLRVESGRRSFSLLRQQQLSGASFL